MGFKILQTPYIFAQSVIAFVGLSTVLVQLKHQDVQLHVQLHCVTLQLCKIFIEKEVDSGEALSV